MDAAGWIEHLGLEALPQEGGFFRRIFTHADTVPGTARPLATTIAFLVTPASFSALHRVDCAENFSLLAGGPAEQFVLDPETGEGGWTTLEDPRNRFTSVPPGHWQGLRLKEEVPFALFHVTCTPGFLWEGFALAEPKHLAAQWSAHADDIHALCP